MDAARHGRDLWLDGVRQELAALNVQPACAALVCSMLSFHDAERPSAAELLQSVWLQG